MIRYACVARHDDTGIFFFYIESENASVCLSEQLPITSENMTM